METLFTTSKSARQNSKQMSRIAMVSTHGYVAANPPLGNADTGGQVVYVIELSKHLANLGYQVDIWTRRFEDQEEIEEVAPNVRIIRMPCGGNEFIPKEYLYTSLPEWRQNALRFIRKNKLNYQFINSHYWDGGVAAQMLAEEFNCPHLHTPHSLGIWKKRQMATDFPDDVENFEQKYNFKNRIHHEHLLYQSCEIVIATTPVQLELFEDEYDVDHERIMMIPPGYDDNQFYPVSQASRKMIREQLGFEKTTILTLGRLAENKGYDLLIQAFSVVAKRLPDVRLQLAVGGDELSQEEKEYMEQLQNLVVDSGLSKQVTFSGFIPSEDLPDYYRAATLFAMPSRYEPFGMTGIEAMACGTATILTIHGGLWRTATFGRHATYADPFDPEEFGIAMYQMLKYPRVRHRLERMGAHKVRSLFTWTGIAQQLVGLAENRHSSSMNSLSDQWDEPWNADD
ncbi:MAG: glycosyltransferase [SAR324 cluster bacterium]|nr:glycosyltransferase [SAR324 cluster bacterium]